MAAYRLRGVRAYMSDSGNRNVFLICVTVMFCVTMGLVFGITRINQDKSVALTIITILFTNLGAVIATLATLFKANTLTRTADDARELAEKSHTELKKVTNGVLQSAVRDAIETELPKVLIKHSVIQQKRQEDQT